ncbi:MAG: hypothetical protein QOD40_1916 [Alphaproteobacteria bacterium]|nr:hypothetical protein [Alphaproteobacteria bacterium]
MAGWTVNGNDTNFSLSGKVGIGTTTPARKLEVSGDDVKIRVTNTVSSNMVEFGWDTGNLAALFQATNGSDIKFYNGQYALTMLGSNGNVGIGTGAPSAQLHINLPTPATPTNDVRLIQRFTRPQDVGTKWGGAFDILLGSYGTDAASRSRVDFKLANTETNLPDTTVITMNANGHVGIGTTIPQSLLHIEGPGSAGVINYPAVAKVVHGSSTTPITSSVGSSFAVIREEAVPGGLGQGDAAIYAQNIGHGGQGGAPGDGMPVGVAAYVYTAADGESDCTALVGVARTDSAANNARAAFGAFVQAEATVGNNMGAIACESQTVNSTGFNYRYSPAQPTTNLMVGFDIGYGGTGGTTGSAGVMLRASPGLWDVGYAVMESTVATAAFISPGFKVDALGNQRALSNTTTSDERLKHDIVPLNDGALEKIVGIQPVSFRFNQERDPSDRLRTHVIGQDVLPVIPEAVVLDSDGFYSVDDGAILAYAIKAIQELTARVRMLEASRGLQ